MRRLLPAAGLLALAACIAAAPGDAAGCAAAPREGQSVAVADETALIVWDEAAKTEHFVRRATFVGSAYDFGFLVPTPTRPDLAPADDDLFAELARVTEPATEVRTVSEWGLGCSMAAADKAAGPADATPGGVVVLEQKRVGDLDAAVLKFRRDKTQTAEDAADELLAWLNRNQYAVRPDLTAWLAPYIRDQWIITAFKVAGRPAGDAPPPPDAKAAGPNGVGVKATAVRMSFRAERPFFPYREPADQRAGGDHPPRLLRAYVAARQRVVGKLGGAADWPGRTVWANALADPEKATLSGKAKLPPGAAPGKWWLTEFEDRSSPRPGTDEVYFEPSADQTTVARPPRVLTRHTRPWWFAPIVYGIPILVIGGGIAYLLRRTAGPGKPTVAPAGDDLD